MTITKLSAQELFRAAYENRYTWDKSFPGYTADITYKYDDQVFTGKVVINGELKAEVLDVEDEAAKKKPSTVKLGKLPFTVSVAALKIPTAPINSAMVTLMKLVQLKF